MRSVTQTAWNASDVWRKIRHTEVILGDVIKIHVIAHSYFMRNTILKGSWTQNSRSSSDCIDALWFSCWLSDREKIPAVRSTLKAGASAGTTHLTGQSRSGPRPSQLSVTWRHRNLHTSSQFSNDWFSFAFFQKYVFVVGKLKLWNLLKKSPCQERQSGLKNGYTTLNALHYFPGRPVCLLNKSRTGNLFYCANALTDTLNP